MLRETRPVQKLRAAVLAAIGRPRRRRAVHYAPAPKIEQLIFIGGLHRSGTTLLEDYLSRVLEVSVLRAEVPENEGQHMQRVYPRAQRHGGPGAFAFAPAMCPAPPTPDGAARLRARLLADWSRFVVGEAPILLEKSPPNLTKIAWLRAVFPGARFVLVVRDPRAVASATQKWTGAPLDTLIRHWDVAHRRAQAEWGPDCSAIRYEAFCEDPAAAIDACSALADLPRREVPLDGADRFRTITNSNDRYVSAHAGRSYGPGAWEAYGYTI